MIGRVWVLVSGALAAVGLFFTGLVTESYAQWSVAFRDLHRGLMSHSITNKGMGGRKDGASSEGHSFGYPMGKNLLVYSGGSERNQWNNKTHTAGEGVWIMSKTGGSVKTAYAGTTMESGDLVSLAHTVSKYPEAYLGCQHHWDWALSVRSSSGSRITWTDNIIGSDAVYTNYWPAKGTLSAGTQPKDHPVVIWNYGWNEYRSGVPFSQRIASGDLNQLSPPAWAENLSAADYPDLVAISKAKSNANNLQWTRRWFKWAQTDYDDFIMNENVIENVGSASADEVYFVIKNRFVSGAGYYWSNKSRSSNNNLTGERLGADDYVRSTLATNYLDGGAPLGIVKPAGSALGKQLANQGHPMVYLHDGEQRSPTYPHMDWGDPFIKKLGDPRYVTDQQWITEGYFNHADYFGLGVVDAIPPFNTYGGMDTDIYEAPYDNPATSKIDESVQQPASITMWRWMNTSSFEQPDPGKDNDQKIFDDLTKEWGTSNGYQAEPDLNDAYSQFVTFGPYKLAPGQKCKVVVAYVGGMAAQQAKYSDYKKYAKPFEFAWMNMYNGPGADPVDYRDRQLELPLGEAAMFTHFQRAIQVYDWGYKVPEPPPNIRLTKDSNLQGKNLLTWSAFGADTPNPDYTGAEAKDIVGYRIYRGAMENQGPFELAAEFTIADAKAGKLPAGVTYDANGVFHTVKTSTYPDGIPLTANRLVSGADPEAGAEIKGLYSYVDAQSRAGFPFWYAVRYYTAGHASWKGRGAMPSLESPAGPGGVAIMGRNTGTVPVVPAADAFTKFQEKVAVVPNPYRVDDQTRSYKNQQNIRFINLPGRCQIEIFDVMGQRVWTQFLNDLTTGELTWLQFTENRPSNFGMAVFPGVYFFKVTNLMPEPDAGGSKWKFQTGTFLIMK